MSSKPSKKTTVVCEPEVEYYPGQSKHPQHLNDSQIAYGILRAEGLNQKQAAKVLGISTVTAWKRDKELNVYEAAKGKLLDKSVRNLHKLIEGKGFGTIDKVKDSTALAAIGMVLDREVPKVALSQSLSVNVNLDHCPIDLDSLR